jgi:hypothetical protein
VRCSAATDELLTTLILQQLQPRRVGQGSENSGAAQSEECTASQSGIPVRKMDSLHRIQRLRRGSRVRSGSSEQAAGCVRGWGADRALDSAQLKGEAHNAQLYPYGSSVVKPGSPPSGGQPRTRDPHRMHARERGEDRESGETWLILGWRRLV